MQFTTHAVERYRQFWMLDNPTATDSEAREILERHAAEAIRLPSRTRRGDEVWAIHALGIEIVVKRDTADPTCVTVLPPPTFRGLSPLQAERLADAAKAAEARAEALKVEIEVAEAAKEKVKAVKATKATVKASPAEAAGRNASHNKEIQEHKTRIENLRAAYAASLADRDVFCSIMKTMRTEIALDENQRRLKRALRAALRAARAHPEAYANIIARVGEVSPMLAEDRFIDSDYD